MEETRDIIAEAIQMTAQLMRENAELKSDNLQLRSLLHWCWYHPLRFLLRRSFPALERRQRGIAARCADERLFARLRDEIALERGLKH